MSSLQEWFALIDQEEGEQLVCEIMEEILQKSQQVIFERHIESQVLPYAVKFAKDTLLKMVQWEFFRPDAGSMDVLTWAPDKECDTSLVDSWARAAVPLRKMPVKVVPEKIPEFKVVAEVNHVEIAPAETADLQNELQTSKTCRPSSSNSKRTVSLVKVAASDASINKKRTRQQEKTESKAMQKATTEQLILEENKRTLSKIKKLKEDGTSIDFAYDTEGKIHVLKKPSQISNQGFSSVRIKIKDEDKLVENIKSFKKRTNRKSSGKFQVNQEHLKELEFSEDSTLDAPHLADYIKISQGVVLKEGEIIKRGPPSKKIKDSPNLATLKEISKKLDSTSLLNDVLGLSKPVIKYKAEGRLSDVS